MGSVQAGDTLPLTGAPFYHGFNHLWNDLSCPLHENPVANAQVFALDVPFIMQRGAGHCDPANIDRFQSSPGID